MKKRQACGVAYDEDDTIYTEVAFTIFCAWLAALPLSFHPFAVFNFQCRFLIFSLALHKFGELGPPCGDFDRLIPVKPGRSWTQGTPNAGETTRHLSVEDFAVCLQSFFTPLKAYFQINKLSVS